MNKVLIDVRDENKWIREALNNKDLITVEDLLDTMQDLIDENENLKEELHDLKVDIEENYQLRNNDPYDYYGISRED